MSAISLPLGGGFGGQGDRRQRVERRRRAGLRAGSGRAVAVVRVGPACGERQDEGRDGDEAAHQLTSLRGTTTSRTTSTRPRAAPTTSAAAPSTTTSKMNVVDPDHAAAERDTSTACMARCADDTSCPLTCSPGQPTVDRDRREHLGHDQGGQHHETEVDGAPGGRSGPANRCWNGSVSRKPPVSCAPVWITRSSWSMSSHLRSSRSASVSLRSSSGPPVLVHQPASPSMTSAPGSAPASRPGSSSLERRTPEPITATSMSSTRESTSSRHAGGQPDRGDAAVLHPGLLDRAVHRQERALADVEGPLDHVVDVGPGVRADQAGGDPLLAVALAADHHAVGAGVHAEVVGLAHRGGVGDRRVDLDDGQLAPVLPRLEGGDHRRGQQLGVVERRQGLQPPERGEGHGPIKQQPTSRPTVTRGSCRSRRSGHLASAPSRREARSAAAGDRAPGCARLPARAHAGVVPAGDRARRRRRRARPGDDRGRRGRAAPRDGDQRHHRRGRRTRSSRTGAPSRTVGGREVQRLVLRGPHPGRAEDPAGRRAAARAAAAQHPLGRPAARSPPSTSCSCWWPRSPGAGTAGSGCTSSSSRSSYLASIGLPLEDAVLASLRDHGLDRRDSGVVLQSFETANLRWLRDRTDLPLVQLVEAVGRPGRPGRRSATRRRTTTCAATTGCGRSRGTPTCWAWPGPGCWPGRRWSRRRTWPGCRCWPGRCATTTPVGRSWSTPRSGCCWTPASTGCSATTRTRPCWSATRGPPSSSAGLSRAVAAAPAAGLTP